MKYSLERTKSFKRSFKKLRLSNDEEMAYIEVVYHLLIGKILPQKYKDHQLSGNLSECRECHIKPDLLLIYMVKDSTIILVDIGSHSELFRS